jgi:hypothetical protein
MSTISETNVVVFAPLISMPEIDHCSVKRAAASRQHKTRKFKLTGSSARLSQVTTLWRSWLEKRALGLRGSRFITIATGRRSRKLLRQHSVRTGQFPSCSKHAGVEQKSATTRFR